MAIDGSGATHDKRSAKKKRFGAVKRDHQPSRETLYPQDKVRLVLAKVPGQAGAHDGAPHAGYDLCAPLQAGRFAHWKPGKMPLPPDGEHAQSTCGAHSEGHQEGGARPPFRVPGSGQQGSRQLLGCCGRAPDCTQEPQWGSCRVNIPHPFGFPGCFGSPREDTLGHGFPKGAQDPLWGVGGTRWAPDDPRDGALQER